MVGVEERRGKKVMGGKKGRGGKGGGRGGEEGDKGMGSKDRAKRLLLGQPKGLA